MHDTRAFRNSFPGPASRLAELMAAFHLPSGEHGCWPRQGTFPRFSTWNVFTALPTLITVKFLIEYLTLRLPTVVSGPLAPVMGGRGRGVRWVT